MDYLVATSPDLLNRAGTNVPTIHSRTRRHLVSTRNGPVPLSADSSRKFAIGAFLPLPSISASPICSPTSSISPQDSMSEESVPKTPDGSVYTTAPSSPVISSLLTPPTWISTPPTPPPGMVRRSVTCFPRSAAQVAPSASFPDTTLPHQNDYFVKRCNSVPPMPLRPPLITSHSHQSSSSAEVTLVASTACASGRVSPCEERSLNRSKHLFHIINDTTTDTEEYSPRLTTTPEQLCEDFSVEGSCSENESEDSRHAEKAKDDVRRYHALKELLDTEVGYLLDLRALVTVYLRIIPTLVCRPPPTTTFSRASSSFTASPWINAHTLATTATTSASSSAISSDGNATASLTTSQSKSDPQKSTPRYLFTNLEVEVLTRNAEEILQLHERFVRELRTEMAPLGLHLNASQRSGDPAKTLSLAIQNTGTAIRIVSTKFAAEAPRFASYQSFCTGHTEAVDLVRRVVAQRPVEWDAFEQRCSTLVEELELRTAEESAHNAEEQPRQAKDRSRAASMSSLEGAVQTLPSVTLPADGASPRKEKGAPRLTFIDYMIKPVQRICKYPLILDQLRSGKSIRAREASEDMDAVVESAKEAMKHVASAVDEARRRQDVAMQSALIASRISLPNPATMSSSVDPALMALSQPFISSLGTCLLAGSLDVVHHSAQRTGTNLSVKYLGAFLYLGGYLILVKVTKGKVYEPKHWLSLAEFDIADVDDADAMLPYTICIIYKDHRFDLAAACQREKDAWLQAIQESRNHQPTWINEPAASLRFDGKGDLIPSALDDGPFELVNVLPTIQSIPELNGHVDPPVLSETVLMAFGASDNKQRRSHRHQDDPLSRRSSSASVKGIFSPLSSDSETIVIRRYSASARSRVDHGLQDVISQLCLTARSYASFKDEELFPAPKATRGVFVRSQSGLSITNMAAKSRLTRHESVRVLKRRSLIEKHDGLSSKKSSMSSGHSSTSRKQSTAASSVTVVSDSDAPTRPPSSCSPSLPSSSSAWTSSPRVCSSPSKSSIRNSIFFSSTIKTPGETTPSPMKTSRSLVHGVKELLFPHSRTSSALSLGQNESSDTEHGSKRRAGGSLRRWAKGSLHRRTQSAPNEEAFILPDIQKLPALSIPSLDLPGIDFAATTTTIPLSGSPKIYDSLQNTERLSADKPALRSSFIPSGRCQSPTMVDNHGPSKHTSLLRRLKA